jgi:hypothetical protein
VGEPAIQARLHSGELIGDATLTLAMGGDTVA